MQDIPSSDAKDEAPGYKTWEDRFTLVPGIIAI
jgi:hypothetical protein